MRPKAFFIWETMKYCVGLEAKRWMELLLDPRWGHPISENSPEAQRVVVGGGSGDKVIFC